MFDALRDEGAWSDTAVIFSSDHGEEFGEHGRFFHRNYPYDELIHVPLMVKTPESTPAGVGERRVLLDLAPTIRSLHGIGTDEGDFHGRPLFGGDERTVLSLGQPIGCASAVAVRTGRWKYVHAADTRPL